MPPKLDNKYSWHTIGLDKELTFKLRKYVREHPELGEANSSVAIVELISEALNSDAVQRNIEFVKLLEDMESLSARDKEGLALWTAKKNQLLGVD